jgi:taurine dioxygenase
MTPLRTPTATMSVHPLTPSIGAVIDGIDLSRALDEATLSCLDAAIATHHVVFVRGQSLDVGQHTALAERFGPLTVHPVDRLVGVDKRVSVIVDGADRPPAAFPWHTDLSWLAEPPRMGILHALDIPAVGGDTLWASGVAMMRRLALEDPTLARQVLGLRVVHRLSSSLLRSVEAHHGPEVAARLAAEHPPVSHPLVIGHPTTGEPSLFLCPLYAVGVDGMAPEAGQALLDRLHRLVDDPTVQVRWRWRTGDVVLWDETTTVHRALGDHFPSHRAVRRCSVDRRLPR